MIPKRLTIKGVYSYQNTQIIDFSRLQEANIFGIFGKVGTGKSTILEAMMFALYDEVQRLHAYQRHDLMNLQSDQLEIVFEFEAKDKLYRSRVSAKRDKKRKVGTFLRRYDEWVEEEWRPLENGIKAIQKAIGLSVHDFKKAVVIPQNSFQEFLKMKGKERSDMMSEIFGLHAYNLSAKTNKLFEKTEKVLENLEGQLLQIKDASAEIMEAKIVEKAVCEQTIEVLNAELVEKQALAQGLKQLKLDFENQQKVLKKFEKLKEEQPIITRLTQEVADYELVLHQFKPIWTTKVESSRLSTAKKQDLARKQKAFQQQSALFETAQVNYLFWKPKYEERELLQREVEDLNRILEIQAHAREQAVLEISAKKGDDFLVEQRQVVANAQQALQFKNTELEQLILEKPAIEILNLVQKWFNQMDVLKKEALNLEMDMAEATQRMDDIETAKENLLKLEWYAFKWQLPFQTKLAEAIEFIKNFKNKWIENQSSLENELAHLKASEKLEIWAKNLKEGDNCPLCGGTHHPNVFNLSNVKQNVKICTEKINKIKTDVARLNNTIQELLNQSRQKTNWKETRTKHTNSLTDKQLEIQKHLMRFAWTPTYTTTDLAAVEQAFATLSQIENKQKVLSKSVQTARQALDKATQFEQAGKDKLQVIKNDIKTKTLLINDLQKKITVENIALWSVQSEMELTTLIDSKRNLRKEIETKYIEFEQQYRHLNAQISSLKGGLAVFETEVMAAETAADVAATAWTAALANAPFENEAALLRVLEQPINLMAAKKQIQTFEIQWISIEKMVQEGAQKLANQIYIPQSYETCLTEIGAMNGRLQAAYQMIGKLSTEMEAIREKVAKQAQIETEKTALNTRIEHLKTMRNLFKGSGFVNYASSVHLKNICRNANDRFLTLTRHQLELDVNHDNQFMVIDRLNGGEKRSIDTLSGGQLFQASLCLALALADNIQSLTQAKQHFFFLDEGFGSLDKDSLQIVFETLKGLRRENRIVGIISHVEEMQQEIDCHLKVSLNGKGSVVTASWDE